jgi:hypothetical protein
MFRSFLGKQLEPTAPASVRVREAKLLDQPKYGRLIPWKTCASAMGQKLT